MPDEPVIDQAADVKTILVVTAHPDDVDFGAAGSVATWTDKGIDVQYCIVTDGDAGGFDPAVPRSEIPRIRREEQTKAAKTVGVTELHFLGYPDGRLVVEHRAAPRHLARDPPGAPRSHAVPVARTQSDADLREPSRPSRRR